MAHAHTSDAALRCVRLGVRTIEHGTLIDADTARRVAESDAYVVPTLVIVDQALKFGKDAGLTPGNMGKLREVAQSSRQAFDHCVRAGVKLGFGTDLLGVLQPQQSLEFTLRREFTSPFEILRSATATNAAILNRTGELGTIAPNARADLLVIDGNPLEDISILERSAQTLQLVMKDGVIYKNTLE